MAANGVPRRAPAAPAGGKASATRFSHGSLTLAIYSQQPLSPALIWQFNLLVQLLNEFYVAQLRERELQQLSYLQAIHETGARLTHDVKNLLQSLNALCIAAASEGETPSAAVPGPDAAAVAGHRPAPAADAGQAQACPSEVGAQFIPAEPLVAELQDRYAQAGMSFSASGIWRELRTAGHAVRQRAENLLQNALAKKLECRPCRSASSSAANG